MTAGEPTSVVESVKTGLAYADPRHPLLRRLREQERVDEVIAGARTDLERALSLKRWVGLQWKCGTPGPYPPRDAVTITDWIRSGKTGGFCGWNCRWPPGACTCTQRRDFLTQQLAARDPSAALRVNPSVRRPALQDPEGALQGPQGADSGQAEPALYSDHG